MRAFIESGGQGDGKKQHRRRIGKQRLRALGKCQPIAELRAAEAHQIGSQRQDGDTGDKQRHIAHYFFLDSKPNSEISTGSPVGTNGTAASASAAPLAARISVVRFLKAGITSASRIAGKTASSPMVSGAGSAG